MVHRTSSAEGREPCGSLTAPRPANSWHASYCTWRTGSLSSSAWYAAAFRSATRWRSCSTRPSMWCWCARSAYLAARAGAGCHRRRRGAREGYQRRAGRSAVDSPGLHRRRNRPQSKEIERRRKLYTKDRPPVSIRGATAIVVDDGIATGASMRVALHALRRREPAIWSGRTRGRPR